MKTKKVKEVTKDTNPLQEYLAAIGKKGGESRSKKKLEAVRNNIAKARKAKARYLRDHAAKPKAKLLKGKGKKATKRPTTSKESLVGSIGELVRGD